MRVKTGFLVDIMSGGIGSVSRGGFNDISHGSKQWLVKPAPTIHNLYYRT